MKLIHPSTILVSGPTGSGKTLFVASLIDSQNFEPIPNKIFWVYNEWQKIYEELNRRVEDIEFIKGDEVGRLEELYEHLSAENRNLVVIDDQMEQLTTNRVLPKLFTQGSHHRNLTAIYLVQNLFHKGASHRTVSLNSQYIVLFKNPRDKIQVETLARQMFPGRVKGFIGAFEHATRKPYTYLLLDLRPETPEEFRLRSKILPWQTESVYMLL